MKNTFLLIIFIFLILISLHTKTVAEGYTLYHKVAFGSKEKEFPQTTRGFAPINVKEADASKYTGKEDDYDILKVTNGNIRGYIDAGTYSYNVAQIDVKPNDLIKIEYTTNFDSNVSLEMSYQLYGGKTINIPNVSGTNGALKTLEVKTTESGILSALWVSINNPSNKEATFKIKTFQIYRNHTPNKLDADAILKTPPTNIAKIGNVNGVKGITINEKPITNLGWTVIVPQNAQDTAIKTMLDKKGWEYPKLMCTLGESLFNGNTLGMPNSWLDYDTYDFSYLNREINRLLKVNPTAKITLLVCLDGTKWWMEKNPTETTIERHTNTRIPDYLSEKWIKDSSEALKQMIAYIQTTTYKDNVIAIELFNGPSLDTNYMINDDAEPSRKAFQKFLKDKYKTNANLQKAWKKKITFDTARLVTLDDYKDNGEYGSLLTAPFERQAYIDSKEFKYWGCQYILTKWGETVKKATHNRYLYGARFGDFTILQWAWKHGIDATEGNTRAIDLLLKSPYFDFFDCQEPYPGRFIGKYGSGAPINPIQGIAGYNKILLIQNDVRPHTGPDFGFGATKNAAETIEVQRRIFCNSLMMGSWPYLWQMSYSYETPEIQPMFNQIGEIYNKALKTPLDSMAEVAVVMDLNYLNYFGRDTEWTEPCRAFTMFDYSRFTWARSGASYDIVFLDQINKIKPYNVYIFNFTVNITPKQIEEIQKTLAKNKATGIFMWADGFINGTNYSDKNMISLTGINIKASTTEKALKFTPSTFFVEKTKVAKDYRMGTVFPTDEVGDRVSIPGRNSEDYKFAPSFTVEDKTATPLAYYESTKDVAIAYKKYKNFNSIYTASFNAMPALIRYALELSKGHIYTDTEDIFWQNKSFLGFHTQTTGNINLTLKEKTTLYDIFNDKEYSASDKFLLNVTENKTYLFFKGTKQDWEKL